MIVPTGDIIAVKEVDLRLGGDVPHTAQCNTGGPNHDSSPDDAQYLYELRAIRTKNEVLIDLDHPNVVRYLGIDINSVLNEHDTLDTYGALDKHGILPEATTKSFGKQILAGLDYLHSHGVVHGDLTPRKILLTPTGQCKILSLEYRRTPPPNAITPLVFYMAPELVKDRAKPTAACDIWSVGCVLLEMWTGQRPWAGEETIFVLFKLYSGKAPPVPSGVILSDSAEDLRAQCFVVDPTARPSAAELLRHPYFQDPEG
ncbi:kinase-like protein [Schizophyllum commune Loenen D]|nr:kinase-like protein [Schizophyllum commune Loenen D]